MRTIVFDLDGTLADTSGDMMAAANVALATRGVPGLGPGDEGTALAGARAMLSLALRRALAGEALVDQLYPHFIQAYADNLNVHTRLYPGAMAAVAALKARGHPVSICTNKPGQLALPLLRELGIIEAFDVVICADTLPERKPHPAPLAEAVRRAGGDPAHCALIGDTVTDHRTARALGAVSVLVTFGPNAETCRALEPDYLLDDFVHLPSLVAQMG